jgi:CRP-like cAMP-binding protein
MPKAVTPMERIQAVQGEVSGRVQGKAAFWRSFLMFEDLDGPTLEQIAARAVRRDWTAGSTIFRRGEPGDYLVALAEGRVRLSLGTAQGRELVLRHAEPGELLGEMALFDAEPRSADAVAAGPTAGFVLHRTAFQEIAGRNPALMVAVSAYLCRRLRDTTDQLESIALYNLEARLARFLLFTLRQIHGEDMPDAASLRLELSQSDLAAVLGATRSKVNQVLQTLRDSGVVTREGSVMVCDVAALRDLAEPLAD